MINTFGLYMDKNGSVVNLSKFNKGWNQIPKKYKSKENFESFCYMNYMGLDALTMFLTKIKTIENKPDEGRPS